MRRLNRPLKLRLFTTSEFLARKLADAVFESRGDPPYLIKLIAHVAERAIRSYSNRGAESIERRNEPCH